jgi:cellulose synthase (UDP-forming)
LEALRLHWDGCYLPIVGAYAQHSPEDLPNFVKQRGTWALDTVRLTLWAPKRGLTLRQRLQFYELGLFYMQGPATLVFLLSPIFGFLFHAYPLTTSTGDFVLHFWPYVAALELNLALIHRPMSFEQLWRARLVWAGLCFVYARACLLAVLGGPNGKPRYQVTRKRNEHSWHWRLIVPHTLLLVTLATAMGWSLAHHGLLRSFDIGSAYWAGIYGLLLAAFIRLSWHGAPVGPVRHLRAALAARLSSGGAAQRSADASRALSSTVAES